MTKALTAGIIILLAPMQFVTVVPQTKRHANRIVLLVDVSGSMSIHIPDLMAASKLILRQPTDAAEIAVVAWRSKPQAYKTPSGGLWIKLPDFDQVRKAEAWLRQQKPDGGTYIIPALELALALDKKQLSVVVITDGIWSEIDAAVMDSTEELQRRRLKRGHARAVIGVLAVCKQKKDSVSARLGGKHGGGCYYIKR